MSDTSAKEKTAQAKQLQETENAYKKSLLANTGLRQVMAFFTGINRPASEKKINERISNDLRQALCRYAYVKECLEQSGVDLELLCKREPKAVAAFYESLMRRLEKEYQEEKDFHPTFMAVVIEFRQFFKKKPTSHK